MNAKKVKEIKNTYNKIPWNERRNLLDNLSKDVIMDAYE
jgi:hypothetical protein